MPDHLPHPVTIQGLTIPEDRIGTLAPFEGDRSDSAQLADSLAEDGYLFLRDGLDPALVQAAREEVFRQLAGVGEIADPPAEGLATGKSRRLDPAEDEGLFWQRVSEGPILRRLTHGLEMQSVLDTVLSEPARAFDLIYLRPTPVGQATALHYDYPFFAGSAQPMINAWIPIGDIPVEDGPLAIVEHSNRFSDLIDQFLAVDYTADRSNDVVQTAAYGGASDINPVQLVVDRDTRFLTANFRAGDLLLVNMFTLHGSLDNVSPRSRVRLSCDVRFQPAAQPADDSRYFGEYPSGSKGGGYADMRGAQPLA